MATLKWNAHLTEEQEQKYGTFITSDKPSCGFRAQEIDEALNVCSSSGPKQTRKTVYCCKASP